MQLHRIEQDSLGEMAIPWDAYYGIHTFRAFQNFPISGTQVHPELVKSYLLLKRAAAKANQFSGVLGENLANTIVLAVDELLSAEYLHHFIVDAYQAGAGTSQNMNTNEVVANMANKLLGEKLGSYSPIHPSDHVNMSQSTNDTYPTALRLATLNLSIQLENELCRLQSVLNSKALEFDSVLKAARTHLQDAVPIRLGQEFSAYAETVGQLRIILNQTQYFLKELGIGGSASGTGINVPKGYRQFIIKELQNTFEIPDLRLANNMFSAMQSQLPMMLYSNALRSIALELTRIFNDLRLLSSGPNNGLVEIFLPAVQPGSSIMAGKVNPSILEMGNQVCFKVLGNDMTMAFAIQAGQLELNVMMPIMAQAALESTHILTRAIKIVSKQCIEGIAANRSRCQFYAEQTSQIVTALNPLIGYGKSAELVKQAEATGKSIIQLVREGALLSEEKMTELLDPRKLT